MKKTFFVSILCCYLVPLALHSQSIVSMPVTDAKTGATFNYNLGEEDVDALYKCYKTVKKEDGAADVIAREIFRTLLINYFVKNPKTASERLRYARLTSAGLELAEALGNKKDDKPQKESKAASAITLLLQELLPAEGTGEAKNK